MQAAGPGNSLLVLRVPVFRMTRKRHRSVSTVPMLLRHRQVLRQVAGSIRPVPMLPKHRLLCKPLPSE